MFKNPPKFPQGTFDEVRACLLDMSTSQVLELAEILKIQNQTLKTPFGDMKAWDFLCHEVDGFDKLAVHTRWVEWWGGPELTTTVGFTRVRGSFLDWLLDNILYRMSYTGRKVIKLLGLPL